MGDTLQHGRNPAQLRRLNHTGEPHARQVLHSEQNTYVLIDKIGQGGMGQVWCAESSTGETVAVKFIRQFCSDLSQYKMRMRKEAELAGEMKHPNVTRVIEFVDQEDACFLVMEYVPGGDLQSFIRNHGVSQSGDEDGKRIEPAYACRIAKGIVDVYVKAQIAGRRIIHRDLKPENILLDSDGKPKLSDFGIAKDLDEAVGLTQTGFTPGTLAYSAPERFYDPRSVSLKSDMYSLGIIMYQMLAGDLPFERENFSEYKDAHCWTIPKALHLINPEVDRGVSDVVASLLAKKPEARFSPSELLAALNRIEEGREAEFPDAFRSWMNHPSYRWVLRMEHNKKSVVSLLLMSILLLGTLGFLMLRSTPSEVEIARKAECKLAIIDAEQALSQHGDGWNAPVWDRARAAIEQAETLVQDKEDRKTLAILRTQLKGLEADRNSRFVEILLAVQKNLEKVETYADAANGIKAADDLVFHSGERQKLEVLATRYLELEQERVRAFSQECGEIKDILEGLSGPMSGTYISTGELHYLRASELAITVDEKNRLAEIRLRLDTAESERSNRLAQSLATLNDLLESGEDLRAIESEVSCLRKLMRFPKETDIFSEKLAAYRSLARAEQQRKNNFAAYLDSAADSYQKKELVKALDSAEDARGLARTEDEKGLADQALADVSEALSASLIKHAKSMESQARYAEALELYRRAFRLSGNSSLEHEIAAAMENAQKEEARVAARRKHRELVAKARTFSKGGDWEKAAGLFRQALTVAGFAEDAGTMQGLVQVLTDGTSDLIFRAGSKDDWKRVVDQAEEALEYDPHSAVARQHLNHALNQLEPPVLTIRALSHAGKTMNGVRISVDGELLSQTTPVTLRNISVGKSYKILADAGGGYVPYRSTLQVSRGVNTLDIEFDQFLPRGLDALSLELLPVPPVAAGKANISFGFWVGARPVGPDLLQKVIDAEHSRLTWLTAAQACRDLTERERASGNLPLGYVVRLPTVAELEAAIKHLPLPKKRTFLCLDRYDSLAESISCRDSIGPVWGNMRTCWKRSVRQPVAPEAPVDADLLVVLGPPLAELRFDELPESVRNELVVAFALYAAGNDYMEAGNAFEQAIREFTLTTDVREEDKLFINAYIQQSRAYAEFTALKTKYLTGKSIGQKMSPRAVQRLEAAVRSIVRKYGVVRDDKYKAEVEEGILEQAKKSQSPERPMIF